MTECEDCEERDARIAELEEEVRSVGTIGAMYGAEKAKDKIKALKIDYDLCVTDRARIFHRMQAAEAKVKKLRNALENIEVLHTPGKPWSPIECFGKTQSIARQALKETGGAE